MTLTVTMPRLEAAIIPIRSHLKVCAVCGQIYDVHHMGEVFHHEHEDGGERPLPPDTR